MNEFQLNFLTYILKFPSHLRKYRSLERIPFDGSEEHKRRMFSYQTLYSLNIYNLSEATNFHIREF